MSSDEQDDYYVSFSPKLPCVYKSLADVEHDFAAHVLRFDHPMCPRGFF